MAAPSSPSAARAPRRRRVLRGLAAAVVVFGVLVSCGMNPSVPSDWLINLWPVPAVDATLRAQPRTLVVLQHGMWRSAFALGRIERALRAHGYEVLNVSYPSTRAHIEDHAERLARAISARLASASQSPSAISFVGHSMGGLVIRRYLARPDAVRAKACVFIATPHCGAALAGKRQDALWFRLFMGNKAAKQLVCGDPFYDSLRPLSGVAVGNIIGGKGDGQGFSSVLEGDDDGTVRVAEAHLDGEQDTVLLPLGHTRIGMADATIKQVLSFLRTQRFAPL
jgi:pimeloyl-ACP methyl ester carboxylesterase